MKKGAYPPNKPCVPPLLPRCARLFHCGLCRVAGCLAATVKTVAGVGTQKAPVSREERNRQKTLKKAILIREKADKKRFRAGGKSRQLVFYSEKSGFYKYFRSVVDYILANSSIDIHYVTSDPDDAIFECGNPKIHPYYIGEKALIAFMMKMDADIVVMTMPDLQKYHIKRSIVRKDIEYVYMFHTVASMHMTLREGSVDHYDTIFCVGRHHVEEIRKTEEVYGLPPKKLIECGYGLIDDLIASYNSGEHMMKDAPRIMIAPSWQADNILDACIDKILAMLMATNCHIVVRPHPEYIRLFPYKINGLLDKTASYPADRLDVETDFSSNLSIYESDIMITDWSNIAFEFSYSTRKPSIFIDTPMKIQNPHYVRLNIEPLDIVFRRLLGVSVKPGELELLPAIVDEMLANPGKWNARISDTMNQYLFNPGESGKIGGEYIINRLQKDISD